MSVQLIVFPQYPESSSSLSSSSNQFFVDGINFNQVNGSSSTQSISGALPQTFINSSNISFSLSLTKSEFIVIFSVAFTLKDFLPPL